VVRQAISVLGDYVFDTTLALWVATELGRAHVRGVHSTVLGVHIAPIDTIWTVGGLLMIAAGGYGMFALPREAAEVPAEVAAERA
jgi:hypothetical protein